MKKLASSLCLLITTAVVGSAHADVSLTANAGAVTQYIFRGIPQSDGKAAAQGGIDLDVSGFYLGGWLSQVDTSAA